MDRFLIVFFVKQMQMDLNDTEIVLNNMIELDAVGFSYQI